MKVNYDMKVKTNTGIGLNVRSGPALSYPRVSGLYEGQVVRCVELNNGWYRHSGGWSAGNYLVLIKDYGTSTNTVNGGKTGSSTNTANKKPTAPTAPQYSEYEKSLLNSIYNNIDLKTSNIDSVPYILGAPFQFTPVTDPRPSGSSVGRMYMETLLNDMSMMVITPGEAEFMSDFSNKTSKSFLESLIGTVTNGAESLANLLTDSNEKGRYYTFKSNYSSFVTYLNNMCRLAAQFLGIGNKQYNGQKYKDYDWDLGKYTTNSNSKLFNFLTCEKSIPFYIDAKASSFSDGVSTSIDDSLLESTMGKGSDLAKEALFLFGKSYDSDELKQASLENYEEAVQSVIKSLTDDDGKLQKRLSDHANTLFAGGNIAFPKIWKDTTYNKSYDVVIKLVSPYGDIESFFLYILVPMFHLITLAYPKQVGANGYSSPYLVRVFTKGWFNCTMGIIDSISIKRASNDGWSVHGFPTEVEINLSIKDMYDNLTISRSMDYSTFHNTEYLDMIATWCGVNINMPEINRKISLYAVFTKNYAQDLIGNIVEEYREDISNKLRSYFTL